MDKSQKVKFIRDNFEMHARNAAQANAEHYKLSEGARDVLYQAIMNFVDFAFDQKKIEIKLCADWDELEEGYQKAMQDEAIRRGDWDGLNKG